jgi:tetratricopeptide (TPR) repeat protein
MRKLLSVLLIVFVSTAYGQNSYEKAWELLNKNNWTEAGKLLEDAKKDPANFADAYASSIYLHSYTGRETEVQDFHSAFYSKVSNPYPYIYAGWSNHAVIGPSGKKQFPRQLEMLELLIKDEKAPGTLSASANYQLGLHYLFSNQFKKAQPFFDNVGGIKNWQYTGPFENISQSGFYKDYAAYEHPEPTALFKSNTNADVKWFLPPVETREGWLPVCYQFNNTTAVVFAQNFITSPNDQEILCCAGTSGSIKVWVNDELVISESDERVTELDAYIGTCKLKKGVNRVLVQLGYTDNSYANFSVRFTDKGLRPLKDLVQSSAYAPYPKNPAGVSKNKQVVFAEQFFSDKITARPENLVNYLLLADVYLRNSKLIDARNTLATAIKIAPDNCILKMKLVEVLIKENNRTLLLEEVEKIRQLDGGSVLVMDLNIKDYQNDQRYTEMAKELQKRISIYGEDESTADYTLALLGQEKKYEELIKEVERLYIKYPSNSRLVELMYLVKKDVGKDSKAALEIYEKYLDKNYDYKTSQRYMQILAEMGENQKVEKLKLSDAENFPHYPAGFDELSKYYYGTKSYDKAHQYILKAIDLSPYNESYWEQLGDVSAEKKDIKAAIDAYNKSLLYNPNQYIIINKIRKLDGKPETYELVSHPDIDALIKADNIKDAKNTDYGYYYILDQKDIILFPGGAKEEFVTAMLRITNEKGIDRYKESSITRGANQTLLIEKAEVIKKNQARLEGEKDDNVIVFTNLEVGDVVVFKYRLRNYDFGRMAKHFWDTYCFNGQIYSVTTRYSILVPSDQPLYHQFDNYDLKPTIGNVENFKKYSWEVSRMVPEKDENLTAPLTDVAPTLHLSTIQSWNEVANWYSDISSNKAEEGYEISGLYNELFPATTKNLNQFQKAKIIYNYIESNIRYSSVPFRQSAYTPQRPAVTLTTRLGDCKDLSSLFVTLARMAGIDARMVLISTRDNGLKFMTLPSIEFNHCIVKAELDKKNYYIELTDNYLPFNSLPNDDLGAMVLEIPYKSSTTTAELKPLQSDTRQKDMIRRTMEIKPNGDDITVSVKTVKYGATTSTVRSSYLDLDEEKLNLEMEKSFTRGYKNNVKLISASVNDLESLNDSVTYDVQFTVKNEISEIGSIKTFRITYPDVVATLDGFSADTRTFPLEYWSYEDVDQYETTVTITSPGATKFIELPASETYTFNNMKFSLVYTLKAPNKLVVVRKFSGPRMNISSADYPAFKAFFEKIVKAEQRLIAFK